MGSKEEKTDLMSIMERLSEVDGRLGKLARIAIEKVGELEQTVRELEKENQELRDENENVWFMLDELKESQKFSKEHAEYLEKFVKQQVAHLKIMQNNKGEA
tara:strand:- start:163 stop:468 length:306 start_codon:yes stop_codon:yes gene_type:complete